MVLIRRANITSLMSLLVLLLVIAGSASALSYPPKAVSDSTTTGEDSGVSGDSPVQPTTDPPVVILPVQPAPSVPALAPPMQGLLLKQVKLQIVLYKHSVVHWQRLLGMKQLRVSKPTSLAIANKQLAKLKQQSHQLHAAARQMMRKSIQKNRRTVEYWRLVMGYHPVVRTLASKGNLEEKFLLWRSLKRETYKQYSHPPHLQQWLCIHHYEGSWTDSGVGDPPGAEFWGGLQFGPSEWTRFGGRFASTANLATPLEQMWAAESYWRLSGFNPWPNTARYCGLL